VGHEDRKHLVFTSLYCLLFQNINRKSMFAVLHSDINSLKSGLLHLTGRPYCKKCRSAKVKDGIRNYCLRNYLVLKYSFFHIISDTIALEDKPGFNVLNAFSSSLTVGQNKLECLSLSSLCRSLLIEYVTVRCSTQID
jgi:hypothetical protein